MPPTLSDAESGQPHLLPPETERSLLERQTPTGLP
jgi:hypothetical protein